MKHYHLIGIGGSGISAIARVLLERGEQVSGSDRQASAVARPLEASGAIISIGHRAENVQGADLVVRSSAIPDDNVEVLAARQTGIPVLKRAEFLDEFLRGYRVIAVAGTHGKTTTTAMLAWMLSALGRAPSYIIGGVSQNLKSNAHAGSGPDFVIEADEYDHMFLGLTPALAVVTNVEHDHPDCYPTPESFYEAFRQFAGRLLPEGSLVGCADDPGARRLLDEMAGSGRRIAGYGINPGATVEYRAEELSINRAGGYDFQFYHGDRPVGGVQLQVPGVHNVRNALATLAAADLLELPFGQSAQALGDYRGTARRFELRGEVKGITVIDDYAHHPTAIKATLAAARARYPQRDLWVVWQPHTYSRTRSLAAEYANAFEDADHVLVSEVYAAREDPPTNGFSARHVVAAMRHPDARFEPEFGPAVDYLVTRLHPGSVLIVLSAGDADQISSGVLEGLA